MRGALRVIDKPERVDDADKGEFVLRLSGAEDVTEY